MDNGLIFPYRRRIAQANPVMLRARIRLGTFGCLAGLALEPMLVRLAY